MTKQQAEEIANKFVKGLMGRDLRLLGSSKNSRHPDKWGVVFERTTVDGHVIDGPMIVIVDEHTERANLLE